MAVLFAKASRFLSGLLHSHVPEKLHRFTKASFWSLLSSVFGSGGTLLMYMLVARAIGNNDYGAFVLAQSTLGTAGILAAMGMGMAASKYTAELRIKDPVRLGRILALCALVILALGLVLTVVVAVFSDQIAGRLLGNAQVGRVLLYSSGWVMFSTLDGFAKSILLGFEENRKFAAATMLGATVSLPVLVCLSYFHGLDGAALGLSVIALLQASISVLLLFRVLVRQHIPMQLKGCMAEADMLGHTALPVLASSLLFMPVHLVAQSMLSRSGAGLKEVAYFSIGQQWIAMMLFVPSALSRIAGPILINQVSDSDHARARETFRHSLLVNLAVCLPVAVVLFLLSGFIMSLYGNGYREGAATLSMAFAVAALMSAQSPVANLVAAKSKFWTGFAMNAGWAAAYIGFASLWVDYGSFGIMSALLASYVLHSIWSALFVKRHL